MICRSNNAIMRVTDAAEFITLWTVIFDLENNKALCVDSGHGYCVIVRQDGTIHQVEIEEGGPPIGVVPDYPYVGVAVDFNPGDRMVIFSDGLAEQQGPDGNMFEFERVFKALAGSESEQEDVKRLYDALETFAAGRSWQDDVTIMSVCHDS
jgi:serine phosphatase RsbU (regulator of sigma subunit)